MIRHFAFFAAVMALLSTSYASDELSGIYNTGPSLIEAAQGASLDISFEICDDEPDRYCATVVAVHEPAGPSGQDKLPNGELIVGFRIIDGLKHVGDGQFKRGRIWAVDESIEKGEMISYGLRLHHNSDGGLTAHGCVGFICPREMIWTPVLEEQQE